MKQRIELLERQLKSDGWFPDLTKHEDRLTFAILVKL
jgi:hypothetical protein